MATWNHSPLFAEYVAEEDLFASAFRSHRRSSSITSSDRVAVIQQTQYALQTLHGALAGHQVEQGWAGQLLAYVQGLQNAGPSLSPEEQFNYLYQLRKWLFWLPVHLLQQKPGTDHATAVTLAYLYATALALEPLFPDLGSSFCSALALPPLEAIIGMTDAMQASQASHGALLNLSMLMPWPRHMALTARTQALHVQQALLHQDAHSTPAMVSPDTFSYTSIGNLSPAFAPSTPHYATPSGPTPPSSSFLEIPGSRSSFTYGTQTWGAMPSPHFPPHTFPAEEEQQIQSIYDYGVGDYSLGGFRDGFVLPAPPIWT